MNELSSLLKRSLEGLGFCQGDYEDASTTIVWLESRGLKGLDMLAAAWPRLAKNRSNKAELLTANPERAVLDARGGSVLFLGCSAAGIACAAASKDGPGRIEIRHCHDRRAILASLESCAERGLCALAYWSDSKDTHVATWDAHATNPLYQRLAGDAGGDSDSSTVCLICSANRSDIDAEITEILGGECDCAVEFELSDTDIGCRYEAALERGLSVDTDLIGMLTAAADVILVESTELSRLGAGEQQS